MLWELTTYNEYDQDARIRTCLYFFCKSSSMAFHWVKSIRLYASAQHKGGYLIAQKLIVHCICTVNFTILWGNVFLLPQKVFTINVVQWNQFAIIISIKAWMAMLKLIGNHKHTTSWISTTTRWVPDNMYRFHHSSLNSNIQNTMISNMYQHILLCYNGWLCFGRTQ